METTLPGYHRISSSLVAPSLGSSAQVSVDYDLGQKSIPTAPIPNPGSTYSYPISSTSGGKSPSQVVSLVCGVTSSARETHVVGQPTVIVPSTNTNVVIPPPSTGQPSGVQPVVNQHSWGYTYLGNQPPVSNVNYQPTSSGIVYPRMPWLGNMFTPWGQPNWSYMPMPEGTPMTTARAYGGPAFC